MITTIAAAVLILGLLVFVHELGHFLAAKQFGIGVEKFSLGFGPKVVGKKIGETEYLISVIPLGGYVKLMGQEVSDFPVGKEGRKEDGEAEGGEPPVPPEKSFALRPVGQRFWVVLAGPVFNLIFAALVFWGVTLSGAPYLAPLVAKTVQGSPAEQAGFRPGDEVVAIDGKPVSRWDDLVQAVRSSGGKALEVRVRREGGERILTVRPRVMTSQALTGEESRRVMIGVQTEGVLRLGPHPPGQSPDPITAMGRAVGQTWDIIAQTGQAVSLIFRGTVPAREALGGPILIGERAGWHCQAGGVNCVFFAAFLSINLAILNLLPIPVLDGGHIFFYLIEMVRRRPMSLRTREVAQQVGLFFIVLLMIYAFYNDIMRFIAPMP
ncbi:MAG: RIP metalloprotease RseP [Candidatus Tectomicrobia bacterium]|nr:RIP metalloprotease RseP [Candidatus Tectomicrobia bacterium]